MKTASVVASLSRNAGGLFESVRRLHQSLAEIPGVEVTVFGLRDEHTAEDLAAWTPVTVFDHPVVGWRQFGYSPSLRRQMMEMDFDIIHTHGIWQYPSLVTPAWSRRFQRPYVISPHGMLDPWAVKNSAWKKRIARLFYEDRHLQNAACIRALCQAEAQAIREFGLKNPICIIPNGIDLPKIRNQKSEIRNQFQLSNFQIPTFPADRKVLLYLGRIHPKKGLVNLLRAWSSSLNSQLSTLNPWVLAIAGWDQGGHEAELKRLATELGIPWSDIRDKNSQPSASLLFLGPQFNEDKTACYANCDAFILPSFSEGLPMVILEAWAYGKPVLMTPECNLPEGFASASAIRIETDSESIAAGLMRLFRLPSSELDSLGLRGRSLVAGKFTWPTIAGQLYDVYNWVLGRGSRPDCVKLN